MHVSAPHLFAAGGSYRCQVCVVCTKTKEKGKIKGSRQQHCGTSQNTIHLYIRLDKTFLMSVSRVLGSIARREFLVVLRFSQSDF